ncbi:FtsQ-type POTRA domain-containing protein (plasmid) [Rossellomorea sp. AcN35-11]|nr:FtsQ-type POTRA domain-containing protein [Rossellomorea aquimaris]WJV32160.1 FtsQ-type POTRA domain-containing protein [Rossellomorea sp. AcN35-11]
MKVDENMSNKPRKLKRGFSFLVWLFTFIIGIIIYFLSPLGHVSEVTVQGNSFVTTKEIIKVSGVSSDTRYWPQDLNKIRGKILKHDEIMKVEIKRKFPNHIRIEVKEYKKVATLFEDSKKYSVLSNGHVLRKNQDGSVRDLPLLLEWKEGEELKWMSKELSKIKSEALDMISEIRYAPTELNSQRIIVFTTDGMEIRGTIDGFAEKISGYPSVYSRLPEGIEGYVDMEVGFVLKPYVEDLVE